MPNEQNNNRYIPPPSPYKKSVWIDSLTVIYKIAFFIIIALGFFVCIDLCSNGYEGLSIIVFAVVILIAVLTVGFAIVFLELAKDLRNIASCTYQIGAMMIEDRDKHIVGNNASNQQYFPLDNSEETADIFIPSK